MRRLLCASLLILLVAVPSQARAGGRGLGLGTQGGFGFQLNLGVLMCVSFDWDLHGSAGVFGYSYPSHSPGGMGYPMYADPGYPVDAGYPAYGGYPGVVDGSYGVPVQEAAPAAPAKQEAAPAQPGAAPGAVLYQNTGYYQPAMAGHYAAVPAYWYGR